MIDGVAILPYAHPTTVLFVDDSKLFVRDLGLHFPPGVAVEAVDDPRLALQRINREPGTPSFSERHVSNAVEGVAEGVSSIEFDLSEIEDEIHHAGRFRRVSVVVVDYGMPAMTGLEFAKQIRDTSVQKILVTGLADHRVAIKAFNNHDIQRFIPKSDSGLFSRLFRSIAELQHQHFIEKKDAMELALGSQLPKYAGAVRIVDYVGSLCRHLAIVEHYMVRNPPGLVLLTAGGTVHRLLVLDETQMGYQAEFATSLNAPPNVVDLLRSRTKALSLDYALWTTSIESRVWDEYLVDVERVVDTQDWFVGLCKAPQSRTGVLKTHASFTSYLDEIDRDA